MEVLEKILEKEKFLLLVSKVLNEHPEWFGEVILAMQAGLLQAIQDQKTHSCKMETALVALLHGKKVLRFPKRDHHQKSSVREAVASLKSYGGTVCQKEILEKIDADE